MPMQLTDCTKTKTKNLLGHFTASIAWRMRCDWAKSTPYLKITHSAARSHSTLASPCTNTLKRCAALLTGFERTAAREQRELQSAAWAHTLLRADFRFTLTRVTERHIQTIQFEFSLRCVQTCSEKSLKRKSKSKLYQKQHLCICVSASLHKYLYLIDRTAVRTFGV